MLKSMVLQIEDAVKQAKRDPEPSIEDLFRNIYKETDHFKLRNKTRFDPPLPLDAEQWDVNLDQQAPTDQSNMQDTAAP